MGRERGSAVTDLPQYAAGLAIMLAMVCLTCFWHAEPRAQMLRSAAAIAANWLAGVIYVHNTGNMTPWHFSILIDTLAAFAVMYHPAGKVQGFIGLFYCFQIAGHIAFGARQMLGLGADAIFYYDSITYVAWGQLVAMGVWCGGIWIADLVHRLRDSRHTHHVRTGHFADRKDL